MRKPAVVMTAAVSAVLAGGILVATTAGADEAAAPPAASSTDLPGLPAVPYRPGAAGVSVASGPPAVPSAAASAADRAAPGTAARMPARRGSAGGPAKPAANRPATRAAKRPARVPPRTRKPAAASHRAPDKRPAVARPRRGGRSTSYAAARREVTTRQALSTDPRGSVQQQTLDLVNAYRRRRGCRNLTVDRRLIVAANRHAAEMARRGYFAHKDSRGGQGGERVRDAGYRWSRYSENIARGQGSVAEVVDGWMNSSAHRANILDCALREVGVGLAFAGNRTPYWVQDFASP